MVLICSPTNRFKEQKFVSDEVRTFSSYAITFKFTTLSRVHTFRIRSLVKIDASSGKDWYGEKDSYYIALNVMVRRSNAYL